jgi:O-antigen ligase
MSPTIACLIYACGIAGLFYLDRDKSVQTSKALWLPVVYLWIITSRPITVWLGLTSPGGANVEGSPIDAAFLFLLLVAALCVLVQRGQRTVAFILTNLPAPIVIYFTYCLVSVCWSDYPLPALKKWIRSAGDILMILIVLTDEQPVAALRRLFSRVGFVLLPASLLLIKYYPDLGRFYGNWDGQQVNIGVTLDKNLLGVLTFVLSLGAVWRVLTLLRGNKFPDRRRHLLAQGTLLAFGIWLLVMANSATSSVCFALGAGLMLMMDRDFVRRNPSVVHSLVLCLVAGVGVLMLLGASGSAAHALGRNENLTGRTDIWAAVIPMASNQLVGAGFESFWQSPRVAARLALLFPKLPLNEAHNGYIETYLNLGWVGVVLIGAVLADGYRRSVKAFRHVPQLGALLLAYVLTIMTYSVAEAGFRMMDIIWIFFLLSAIGASSIGAPCGASNLKQQSMGKRTETAFPMTRVS